MEKKYKVYKRIAPDGRVYVGCTSQSLDKRAGVNGVGYQNNPSLWAAIQQYGWDSFRTEIVLETDNLDLAARTELQTIKECNSTESELGFNARLQTYITDPDFPDRLSTAIKEGMTSEVKSQMSNSMKEYYRNPENREFHKKRTLRVINKPEVRLKLIRANRVNLAKPEVKAKLRASLKRYWTTERRQEQSQLSRERLALPEVRAKISEGTTAALSSPEVRAKMSAAQYTKWADPEYRVRTQAAMKAACNTPEHKAKMSEVGKEAQNRPEVKAKLSSAFSGLIFIDNGVTSKRVTAAEAEQLIATGNWVKGRMSHGARGPVKKLQGRIWVNKEGISKFIEQSEIQEFLDSGWVPGRGKLNRRR